MSGKTSAPVRGRLVLLLLAGIVLVAAVVTGVQVANAHALRGVVAVLFIVQLGMHLNADKLVLDDWGFEAVLASGRRWPVLAAFFCCAMLGAANVAGSFLLAA